MGEIDMTRIVWVLFLVLAWPPFLQAEQTTDAPRLAAVPGLKLMAVPDVLYSQLPQLPRGQGLVVEQVGPEAPAPLANLNRHDIVLSYDGQPVRELDQL